MSQRVVIVGASLGGLRAAEALRAQGFTDEIIVIGDEPYPPYNRPPLSKDVLASEVSLDAVAFRQRASVADVIWDLGSPALILEERTLRTANKTYDADGLIIATGIRSRRLPISGGASRRLGLRSLDDAMALRHHLTPGKRLVVLGAGFIGCEVAATATKLGCEVQVVAMDERPMQRPLGTLFGEALQRRHEAKGVTFHMQCTVSSIDDQDDALSITLDDDNTLFADVIVEAIGSLPNVEWLDSSGINCADGVLCDNTMRVIDTAGMPLEAITAVGDVARFPNPLFDDVPRRIEHWNIPTDTARRAAASILADLGHGQEPSEAFMPMPAFWSDQFDLRLQAFGLPGLVGNEDGDLEILHGDPSGDVVVAYKSQGRLMGVVGIGFAKELQALRAAIGQ